MKNLILFILFCLGFSGYSQVGEYLANSYIWGEPNTKYPGGSTYDEFTYLNVKEDHSFKMITTIYSSINEEKNCCLKIEGTWVVRDIFLYLEDKEHQKIYYFIMDDDRLIEANIYKLYEMVDPERSYPIKDEEVDAYFDESSFTEEFRKITADSGLLDRFNKYKEQLCE